MEHADPTWAFPKRVRSQRGTSSSLPRSSGWQQRSFIPRDGWGNESPGNIVLSIRLLARVRHRDAKDEKAPAEAGAFSRKATGAGLQRIVAVAKPEHRRG